MPFGEPLTLEDRIQIYNYIKEGYNNQLISDMMNRGKSTIYREIKTNGGRDLYDFKDAHEKSILRLKERYRKAGLARKGCSYTSRGSKNTEAINNLQMQIDILTDTIKELKNK